MRRGTLCATPWAVWDDSGRYGYLQERIYTLDHLNISRDDLGLDDTISSDLMYRDFGRLREIDVLNFRTFLKQ